MDTPTRTTNIPAVSALDEVLGNVTLGGVQRTRRQSVENVARQLAGTAPLRYLSGVAPIFETEAELLAASITDKVAAWVIDDPDVAKIGIWGWNGTAWAWALPLPYEIVPGVDAGAGTANAIQITTQVPVTDGMMVIFPLFRDTTASPVTLSINGGPALTVVTNRGNSVSGLTKNMEILGFVRSTDSLFRMQGDQDVSALVAQAEEFKIAAELAASTINLKNVPDPVSVATIDETTSTLAFDRDPDSEGGWIFDDGDLSAKVALDTEKIGFRAPVSDPTGSTGAWRRNLKLGRIYPEMGGVYGDDTDRVGAYLKMQEASNFAAREGVVLRLSPGGLYRIDGPMETRSNLWIESGPGSVLRQTEWTSYVGGHGAFFTNVYGSLTTADHVVQSGIRFDLTIDGSLIIPTRTIGLVVSGTTDTITLPEEFDGKIRAGLSRLTVFYADGTRETKTVTAWDAGTRVATVSSAWLVVPDNTCAVGEGANDNAVGFARGAYDIVGRVVANDYPSTGLLGGSGGKAVGLEKGVRDVDITIVARRCGWGGWVQGVAGVFTGYSAENQALGNDRLWARDIRMKVDATDCESAFGVYGVVTDTDPSGHGINSHVKADVFARNCGHTTNRIVQANRDVKGGVITIAEGENFTIDLDSVTDDDFNPVWPGITGIDAWRVGSGLSGGIGAVVIGWGRNGVIRARHTDSGATYKCDALWTVDNIRAMYEDSSPSGIPQDMFDLDIEIKHVGEQPTDGLVNQKNTVGTVAAGEITASAKFITNYIPTNIVGNSFSYLSVDVDCQARFAGASGKRVHGKASRIKAEANDLTSITGFRDLRDFGVGAGAAITSILTASAAHNVGTIAAGAEYSFTVSVPGVVAGDRVFATAKYNGARIVGCSVEAIVTAADTVTVYVHNASAVGVTPGNRTWGVTVTRFP